MKFTVREDGTAQLHVEDVLAPYELVIHKVNDHAKYWKGQSLPCMQTKTVNRNCRKPPVEQMDLAISRSGSG